MRSCDKNSGLGLLFVSQNATT